MLQKESFQIVFNDEYIVVLNKIAKIVVVPTPKKEKHTLTSLLEEKLRGKMFPCHRLDRQTTGLIIYAKSKDIQREIMEEFKMRVIRKKYIAFVKGRLRKKTGCLADYIIDREGVQFGEKPKRAKTLYRIIKELKEFGIVELTPITGRTNQLRIQLAQLGNPILGERKYAFRRDFRVNFKRLALHAFFISFIHPLSRERVSLGIDLPEDMKDFLSNEDITYGAKRS